MGQKVAALMGGMGRIINGSHAELTRVPAANVVAVDTGMPWPDFAALPQSRSARESDCALSLLGSYTSTHGDQFEVAGRQALGLELEVTQVQVTAPTIDEHADIGVHGFYDTPANLGSSVVGDTVQVFQ